jgi:hypothetical protein
MSVLGKTLFPAYASSTEARASFTCPARMPLTGRLGKGFRWTGYLKEHFRTCTLRVYLPLSLPPGRSRCARVKLLVLSAPGVVIGTQWDDVPQVP